MIVGPTGPDEDDRFLLSSLVREVDRVVKAVRVAASA